MLPKLLTEKLCSLRSDGDRLAFSCLFTMNKNAEVIKSEFFKSIIRSKASLTY
jgi:exosome complex exonuclease DIS3/RRP44